jgi:hypothetical protein
MHTTIAFDIKKVKETTHTITFRLPLSISSTGNFTFLKLRQESTTAQIFSEFVNGVDGQKPVAELVKELVRHRLSGALPEDEYLAWSGNNLPHLMTRTAISRAVSTIYKLDLVNRLEIAQICELLDRVRGRMSLIKWTFYLKNVSDEKLGGFAMEILRGDNMRAGGLSNLRAQHLKAENQRPMRRVISSVKHLKPSVGLPRSPNSVAGILEILEVPDDSDLESIKTVDQDFVGEEGDEDGQLDMFTREDLDELFSEP